jgi:hypothetical protein
MAEAKGYSPGTPRLTPSTKEVSDLVKWVGDELLAIAQNIAMGDMYRLNKLHVEPAKPREGMIVYADGTDWDPGSGEGFYGRTSSGWQLLG